MNTTTPKVARHIEDSVSLASRIALLRWPLTAIAIHLFLAAGASAQDPPMPGVQMQHQHSHGAAKPIEVEFPRLGRDQANAKDAVFTLESALQIARESNPTLRQAGAGVKAARARAQQAGLYPNPTIGYAGDEIRGGEVHGGKQGFFVEQTIVTAGKLSRARQVIDPDTKLAEIEAGGPQAR